jgi:hypothetical protein
MAITVAQVLAVPISILVDPTGEWWSPTADLIPYLNSFMMDVSGIRRDIYSLRTVMDLVPGNYQTLPSGGIQFLDSYFAANGQSVMFLNIEDYKNSRFASGMAPAPSVNPQAATADPRDRTGFRVFPAIPSPATGATLDMLYAATPPFLSLTTDPYPLGPDTFEAAGNFVLGKAWDKSTEKRDTVKSSYYMGLYQKWVAANLQSQLQEAPQSP